MPDTATSRPPYSTAQALDAFLDTFADGMLMDSLATQMTCTELETLADLYRAAGRDDDAERWTEMHAYSDDEGDDHYNPAIDDDDRR